MLLLQLITHVISGSICDYRSSDWLTTHSAAELWTGCLPFQPRQILCVSCNSSFSQGAKSKSTLQPEELNNNLSFIVNLSEIKPARTSSWPWCCTAWGEEAGWRGSIEAPDGGIDGWQVKWVCMRACVCVWVCACVRKGWDWITLGLGREHGSGCLIDRSHLESIGRSLAGQRRDTHNQRLLTHTKTNHRERERRRVGTRADASMPSVLHVYM